MNMRVLTARRDDIVSHLVRPVNEWYPLNGKTVVTRKSQQLRSYAHKSDAWLRRVKCFVGSPNLWRNAE